MCFGYPRTPPPPTHNEKKLDLTDSLDAECTKYNAHNAVFSFNLPESFNPRCHRSPVTCPGKQVIVQSVQTQIEFTMYLIDDLYVTKNNEYLHGTYFISHCFHSIRISRFCHLCHAFGKVSPKHKHGSSIRVTSLMMNIHHSFWGIRLQTMFARFQMNQISSAIPSSHRSARCLCIRSAT